MKRRMQAVADGVLFLGDDRGMRVSGSQAKQGKQGNWANNFVGQVLGIGKPVELM